MADIVSPTLAWQFSTTTEWPSIDSPTQPNSVVAMTWTSSVTDVGTMFHGVIVSNKITAVAIEIIAKNFNTGDFCCVVCCIVSTCIGRTFYLK